jgi:hypothetical protein
MSRMRKSHGAVGERRESGRQTPGQTWRYSTIDVGDPNKAFELLSLLGKTLNLFAVCLPFLLCKFLSTRRVTVSLWSVASW